MAERELLYNPASMAVADAMMLAQARLLDNDKFFYEGNAEKMDALERWTHRHLKMMQLTNEQCLTGVSISINYLTTKHLDKFTSIMMLNAKPEIARMVQDWTNHYYFLAESNDGIWYAGSPANHLNTDKESRLITPLISSRLPEVIQKIQQRELGAWPEPSYIETISREPTLSMPHIDLDHETMNFQLFSTVLIRLGENDNWHYALPLIAA